MFEDDDSQSLAFGIPVDPEYLDIAREAWRDLRLSIQYGPKDLIPADRARTELVQFLADTLRRRGVPHPMTVAWELVGIPDPKEFASKLLPGEPLGDLTPSTMLGKYRPLVLSRLKHFRVGADEDARRAAELGLLNAVAAYDPAEDVSVGLYAKAHFHIDNEIKRQIRGKASDPQNQPGTVSGDEEFLDDEGESIGERWDALPKLVLSDRTAAIIEGAYDDKGRLRVSRLAGPHHHEYPIVLSFPDVSIIIPRKTVFATALWIVETSERPGERFASRQEEWMSVPATPQELAEFIAAIPTDAIARELPSLSKLEQDIFVGRFFRKPPVLLDSVARKKKISYHKALTTAHRAVRQIAGQIRIRAPIKTQPPIRRPMRIPPPPRNVPLHPPGQPDFRYRRIVEEIRQWPLLDSLWQAVHGTRPGDITGRITQRWTRRARVAGKTEIEVFERSMPRLGQIFNPDNFFG